jgi:hypothetical protein
LQNRRVRIIFGSAKITCGFVQHNIVGAMALLYGLSVDADSRKFVHIGVCPTATQVVNVHLAGSNQPIRLFAAYIGLVANNTGKFHGAHGIDCNNRREAGHLTLYEEITWHSLQITWLS